MIQKVKKKEHDVRKLKMEKMPLIFGDFEES